MNGEKTFFSELTQKGKRVLLAGVAGAVVRSADIPPRSDVPNDTGDRAIVLDSGLQSGEIELQQQVENQDNTGTGISLEQIVLTANEQQQLLDYISTLTDESIENKPYIVDLSTTENVLEFPVQTENGSALSQEKARLEEWVGALSEQGGSVSFVAITDIVDNQPQSVSLGLQVKTPVTYGSSSFSQGMILFPEEYPTSQNSEISRAFNNTSQWSVVVADKSFLQYASRFGIDISQISEGSLVPVSLEGKQIVGMYTSGFTTEFVPFVADIQNNSETTYNFRSLFTTTSEDIGDFNPGDRLALGYPENYIDYLQSAEGASELSEVKRLLHQTDTSAVLDQLRTGQIQYEQLDWVLIQPPSGNNRFGFVAMQPGFMYVGELNPSVTIAQKISSAEEEIINTNEIHTLLPGLVLRYTDRTAYEPITNVSEVVEFFEQHPYFVLADGTQLPWGYVGTVRPIGQERDEPIAVIAGFVETKFIRREPVDILAVSVIYPTNDGQLNRIVTVQIAGDDTQEYQFTVDTGQLLVDLSTQEGTVNSADVFRQEFLDCGQLVGEWSTRLPSAGLIGMYAFQELRPFTRAIINGETVPSRDVGVPLVGVVINDNSSNR